MPIAFRAEENSVIAVLTSATRLRPGLAQELRIGSVQATSGLSMGAAISIIQVRRFLGGKASVVGMGVSPRLSRYTRSLRRLAMAPCFEATKSRREHQSAHPPEQR